MIRFAAWLLLAALGAKIECGADYRAFLGPQVGRGARGQIVVLDAPNFPKSSVVKIYKPVVGPPLPKEKVEVYAARYQAIHDAVGERSVEPRGVIEVEPGKFGLVLSRIPQEERIYNPEWANETTLRDMAEIKQKLIAKKLGISNLSFTILKDGHVVLYDLDEVFSADPASPLYSAERAAKFPGNLSNFDSWAEWVKEHVDRNLKKRK